MTDVESACKTHINVLIRNDYLKRSDLGACLHDRMCVTIRNADARRSGLGACLYDRMFYLILVFAFTWVLAILS